MQIGLYFGSFNPIHTGHLIIAEHVVSNTPLDQVWLVVSPHNPLKPSASLLNEYNRLNLVNLAIEDNEKLKVSDVEFKLPKPSYTIDTLTYLTEKHPQHSFTVIMGSDSYLNLQRWKNYEVLIRDYNFIIYERPAFPVDNSTLPQNFILLNAPLLEISSTFIREQVKKGNSIRYLVADAVAQEIADNGYYKAK